MTGIVDVNMWLSRWPTRRLPFDETAEFIVRLKELKIARAWVGSFDMLLHRDMAGVNERLAADCKTAADLLIPCGAINPMLPDWEDDVRRCVEQHGMRILRVTPGYHGYDLGHERFRRLLQLTAERNLLLQVVVRMEDERTQWTLLKAKDVEVKPLEKLLEEFPETKVQVLNGLHAAGVQQWIQRGVPENVSFDIGTLEGAAGIGRVLKHLPPGQLCFGSHFPLFVWEAAELKLRETELSRPVREMIAGENARGLLG